MKVRIKYDNWLANLLNVNGITLYPFILLGTPLVPESIQHEFCHVRQIRRLGFFRFYITYLFYLVTRGYRQNPFEVEAYQLGPITPLTDAEKAEVNL